MSKFCANCGASSSETARFCNKCGAKLNPAQPVEEPETPSGYHAAPPYQQPAATYSAPPVRMSASAGGLQPNVAGALCYVLTLITGIIFLVLDPYNKDRFIRFHAFQSILFFVAWFAVIIVLGIMTSVLPWPLHMLLLLAARVGGFVLWIFLMYKAYNNEMFKLPVIGDIAEQQANK